MDISRLIPCTTYGPIRSRRQPRIHNRRQPIPSLRRHEYPATATNTQPPTATNTQPTATNTLPPTAPTRYREPTATPTETATVGSPKNPPKQLPNQAADRWPGGNPEKQWVGIIFCCWLGCVVRLFAGIGSSKLDHNREAQEDEKRANRHSCHRFVHCAFCLCLSKR